MACIARLNVVLILVVMAVTPLTAQRNCKKGIPCGNSCIAANKVCRIGTTPTAARQTDSVSRATGVTQKPLLGLGTAIAAGDSAWVASFADGVYFQATCSAAQDLAPANRRYFRTEDQAKAAGFRRSRTPGC